MGRPRNETVSNTEAGVYHCLNTFTQGFSYFGRDPISGKHCDYRRAWFVERLKLLSRAFAVDVLCHTVNGRGYEFVIHVDPVRTEGWSDREVVERWTSIFTVERDGQGNPVLLDEAAVLRLAADKPLVSSWRRRLGSLGEMMQDLNGYLARRINHDNHRGGRIWAGRYKARVLVDELAVLTGMCIVDLAGVELRDGKIKRMSICGSIQHRVRRSRGGSCSWQVAPGAVDTGSLHRIFPSLGAEQYFDILVSLIGVIFEPNSGYRAQAMRRLEEILGDMIGDLELWIEEWLIRHDLPPRAVGDPARLGTIAKGIKFLRLNLAWLGLGIYAGTKNPERKRCKRAASGRRAMGATP